MTEREVGSKRERWSSERILTHAEEYRYGLSRGKFFTQAVVVRSFHLHSLHPFLYLILPPRQPASTHFELSDCLRQQLTDTIQAANLESSTPTAVVAELP